MKRIILIYPRHPVVLDDDVVVAFLSRIFSCKVL